MRDRKVIMCVDGQDSEGVSITTGLPQGSPLSPALIVIHIAYIHEVVEGRVEDNRGISNVVNLGLPSHGISRSFSAYGVI